MFESILEKVLLSNLGQFLQGLDKNNLKIGVWSGNVVIQNISLKPDILNMLELPIQMKFSFIGKLSVKVPWASLGSKPVEVELQDVYLILCPTPNNEWKPVDFNSVHKRMEIMENFVKEYVKKIAEKQKSLQKQNSKSKDEDPGMVARMTERIVDNIQVTIRNIHARFEGTSKGKLYAFGITLEEILIYTTNQKREREFIDRTDQKNKLLPMNKMLTLKKLGIYWNPSIQAFLYDFSKEKIIDTLRNIVTGSVVVDFIINITATSYLTMKNPKDPQAASQPQFDLVLDVDPIDIQLKKMQLQQIINLLEFFTDYKRFTLASMQVRLEKMKQITAEEQVKNAELFKVLFNKLMRNEKKDEFAGEEKLRACLSNEDEVSKFRELLLCLPDDTLANCIKDVLRDIEKDTKMKELQAEEAKKKKSTWSFFGSKPKDPKEGQIDPNELEKLQKYINDVFQDGDSISAQQQLDNAAYQIQFKLRFTLKGGNIFLNEIKDTGNEEGINFNYEGLESIVEINNKGNAITLGLKTISLALKTKYAGSNSYIMNTVIQRDDYLLQEKSKTSLLSIEFAVNPRNKPDGTYIQLNSQALEIVYRPQAIERLVSFFSVQTQDEALRSQARETFESVQDKAKDAANNAIQSQVNIKKSISITIAAPTIVLPFESNGDVHCECWVLNLGNLKVNSKEPQTSDEKINEIYEVISENTRFQYFPSQILYMNVYKSYKQKKDLSLLTNEEQIESTKIFNLIENISIIINAKLKQANYNTPQYANIPGIDVNLEITPIQLKLTPMMVKNLLKIPEIMNYSSDTAQDLVETERTKLLSGCTKMGIIYRKEMKFNGEYEWYKYFVIFKGGYLHFFVKQQDQRAYQSYYIKGAKIYDAKIDDEKPNSFMIDSRYGKASLGFDDEKNKSDWLKIISLKIEEFSAIRTNTLRTTVINETKTLEIDKVPKPKNWNEFNMKVEAKMQAIVLTLLNEKQKVLIEIEKRSFQVSMIQKVGITALTVRLGVFEIKDYLVEYVNPNLYGLITSKAFKKNEPALVGLEENASTELIEINLVQIERQHPDYTKTNTDLAVEIKFGYLFFNCKPQVLKTLLSYFLDPLKENAEKKAKMEEQNVDIDSDVNNRSDISRTLTKHRSTKFNENYAPTEVLKKNVDSIRIIIDLKVSLKEFAMRFIHQKTHVLLSEIALKDIRSQIIMKQCSMDVTAKINNLQVWDMTNYPNTIDSNVEWNKIIPYEILGVGSNNQSLLELNFKSFDPQSGLGDRERRIFSEVKLNLSSIRINILKQPLLRMVDFLSNQLATITQDMSKSQKVESTEVLDEELLAYQRAERKEQAVYNVTFPAFMDIDVSIVSPIITLKPQPTSEEYIEISLGDMKVRNKQMKNQDRLTNGGKYLSYVWSETMYIELNNMGIHKVTKNQKHNISQDSCFKLEFERLLFGEQYDLVYAGRMVEPSKKLAVNAGISLKGDMSPMIIALSKPDYALLMKGLNYNVNYDDQMDYMFIMEQPPIEDVKPIIQEEDEKDKSQTKSAAPMKIDLCLENISLLIIDPTKDLRVPIVMVNLHLLKIDLNSNQDGMKIEVSARDINGSYFEYEAKSKSIYERRMIGKLDKVTQYAYDDKLLPNVIQEIRYFTNKNINKENQEIIIHHSSNEHRLHIKFEKNTDQSTMIMLTLKDFKIYLATTPLLRLADFRQLDSSVMPPALPPNEKNQPKVIPKVEDKSSTTTPESQSSSSSSTMTINASIKNIIVTIPSASTGKSLDTNAQVLTFRGDLSFLMAMYPPPILADMVNDYKNKQFDSCRELMNQDNEIQHINITLNGIEIFVCNLKELLNTDNFKHVRKRNMILPFSLVMNRKIHNVLNKSRTKLITLLNNEVSIEPLAIRLSYGDYVLLFNSMQYQLGQLNAHNANKNQVSSTQDMVIIEKEPNNAKATSPVSTPTTMTEITEEKKEGDNDNLAMIDDNIEDNSEGFALTLSAFQICIINDAEDTLVPVLEFSVHALDTQVIRSKTSMEASGSLGISSNFFNPKPSRWEPILEKYKMGFEYKTSESSPKMTLRALTHPDSQKSGLSINISDQMLEVINYTIRTWQSDFESKRIDKKSSNIVKKHEETIEYVSPYIIYNETGYPLEIQSEAQKSTSTPAITEKKDNLHALTPIFKANYGEKISYLVESEGEKIFNHAYDSQYISHKIKVNVKHPKCNLPELNHINVDKVKTMVYKIDGKDKDNKPYATGSLIVCDLKVINTKKVMVISSCVMITNLTGSKIQIMIENKDNSLILLLEPNESKGIPFDLVNGTISYKILEAGGEFSPKKPIPEFLLTAKGNPADIKCGDHYLSIKATQSDPSLIYYTLNILPAFSIKNCCALPLAYQLTYSGISDNRVRHIKTQETIDETKISRGAVLSIRTKLQNYGWSKPCTIHSSDVKQISSEILMVDYLEKSMTIYVHIKLSHTGAKTFYLYTKTCIINETPYDLYFYTLENKEKKTQQLIAGQKQLNPNEITYKKVLLANEMIGFSAGLNLNGIEISKNIGVGAIGSTALSLPMPNNRLMELGIYVGTKKIETNLFIFTKTITISPRYILINKTKSLIMAKKAYTDKGEIELLTEARTPFIWNEWQPNSKNTISIKLIEKERNDDEYWEWSGGFFIDTVGSSHILIKSKNQKEYKYIRASVSIIYHTLFTIIEEQDIDQTSLKISNKFNDMTIYAYQTYQTEQLAIEIPPLTTKSFAWASPDQERSIFCKFYKEGSISTTGITKYTFDELNNPKQYKILTNNKEIVVYTIVSAQGPSRIMKFTTEKMTKDNKNNKNNNQGDGVEQQIITNMHIDFKISAINLSLIAELKNKDKSERVEVIYVAIRGIELAMEDTSISRSTQVRIKYFNIDNNISYGTSFPVLMTPSKPNDLLMTARKAYFLDALIVQKPGSKDMQWFPSIKFLLAETTVQIDGAFLDNILLILNKFSTIMSSNNVSEKDLGILDLIFSEHPATSKLIDKEYFEHKFQWKTQVISDLGDSLFIEELIIHPIFFNITFQLSKGKSTEVNSAFALNLLTNTLGNIIANLDNAPIKLSGISMLNTYDAKGSVITALVNKYKEEGKLVIFKILGSIDLIGNPVALFGNISTGFKDLIEKPAEGFLHGPLEVTKGLALGAGSLVKNTVSGTFNSIGKITGSVASGFSSLTFDDEYLERREKAKMQRPKHVGDGLLQGATSIATGVFDGVTGVFLKPMEGAKKGGFTGFMKGIGQGVTGIVTKPIVGVLDAASKTSEGVKNTATLLDEKPNENRLRFPRPFYGKDKYYKYYNDNDAELMNYLNMCKETNYSHFPILSAFDVFPNKEGDIWNIFALATDSILLWNVKKKEIAWEIEIDNIEKVEAKKDNIEIYAKRKVSKINDRKIILASCDSELNAFLQNKLIELKNSYEKDGK